MGFWQRKNKRIQIQEKKLFYFILMSWAGLVTKWRLLKSNNVNSVNWVRTRDNGLILGVVSGWCGWWHCTTYKRVQQQIYKSSWIICIFTQGTAAGRLEQSWNCPESVTNAIIPTVGLCYYFQTSSFYNNFVALEASSGPAQAQLRSAQMIVKCHLTADFLTCCVNSSHLSDLLNKQSDTIIIPRPSFNP